MTIKLPASLSFASAAGLFRQSKAEQSGIIDLTQVQDCDSAGIALLVNIIGRLRRLGVPVKIIGVSDKIRQLAHFYELDFLIPQQESMYDYDK